MQALGSVLMRGIRGISPMNFQAWTAILCLPLLLTSTLLFEQGQWEAIRAAGALHWGALLYSAVLASLVGHGLMFYLVQRNPVPEVMPWLLLMPLLATVFGVLVWGDRPGWRLLAGGALVLLGILAITLRGRQRALRQRDVTAT
jgi:O-acetylserine/cysteine efflux transporter